MKDDKNFPLLEGIPCKIVDYKFPDDRDKEFSQVIAKRLYDVLQSAFNDCNLFSFKIEERYTSEETPHFVFQILFNKNFQGEFFRSMVLDANYQANDGKSKYDGTTTIIVASDLCNRSNNLLLGYLFCIYDEEIRKHYPEWTTKYCHESFDQRIAVTVT